MKKTLKILFISLLLLPLTQTKIFSSDTDFIVDTNTQIIYTTGDDFVTVNTEYKRNVRNRNFYFPATGEKTFHIPDISSNSEEEILEERQYKVGTLTVVNDRGTKVNYSLQENGVGEGIYISIPNYKETSFNSPYIITVSYKTHDYVNKVGSFVNIIGTSLPSDTTFERRDEENGTLTVFNYNLTIVTDSNIGSLTNGFPNFTRVEKDGLSNFSFSQTDRIGNSPSLEFGTNVIYKFDLEYKTPKTDNLIPEKYSDVFNAISTNIFELSLPREFSETNQKVYFENVEPLPKDIYKDSEGNFIAVFEVPANKESSILISGYISVERGEWKENMYEYDMPFGEYLEEIQSSEYIDRYLRSTKYWQSNDSYILQEAQDLLKDRATLLDIVKSNYRYINEILEYDDEKATSENTRIGAKEALLGGASVCMEYADLMIALLRAQGIPARAAIGYTNLTEEIQSNHVRHQWVQLWVPEYGWLSVDPSFESNNMKIGQMVDRILWDVFNDDSLSNIRVYSANSLKDLTSEGYSISIYGVNEEIVFSDLMSYTDLIEGGEISTVNNPRMGTLGSTILKATNLGKALLVTIPIIIVLVFLTFILSSIPFLIKRKGKKKTRIT